MQGTYDKTFSLMHSRSDAFLEAQKRIGVNPSEWTMS